MSQVRKENSKVEKDLKQIRDKDHEMVRGIFRFFEVPNGMLEFSFLKHKFDEVQTYKMVDGQIYTIPRMVAHHLANNCWYPEHAYKMDDSGKPNAMISKKKRRCSFEPLDFMDMDELNALVPANIDTVTFLNK